MTDATMSYLIQIDTYRTWVLHGNIGIDDTLHDLPSNFKEILLVAKNGNQRIVQLMNSSCLVGAAITFMGGGNYYAEVQFGTGTYPTKYKFTRYTSSGTDISTATLDLYYR